jgi:hypothetical protein
MEMDNIFIAIFDFFFFLSVKFMLWFVEVHVVFFCKLQIKIHSKFITVFGSIYLTYLS